MAEPTRLDGLRSTVHNGQATLTHMLTELSIAIGTGVVTFFSPCAYALLPGYVGMYLSDGEGTLRSDGVRGLAAAVGVLAVFAATVGSVAVVGAAVQPWIGRIEPLTGLALAVFGVLLLGGSTFGWHLPLPDQRPGVIGFGVFGGVYAVAAVGCVAPLFFGLTLNALQAGPTQAALVLATYGGTIAALLLAVTVAIGVGYEIAELKLARLSVIGQKLGGAVLIAAGIVQLGLTI